ncbi:MAG TPA: 3'-5' exonuclease [Lentimicrobium sp.]|nr:3'-5' exonuclease [Lentimicrobium sp.]
MKNFVSMLDNIKCENVLFLDIETVSQKKKYEELPENFKTLWDHKAQFLKKNEFETPNVVYERAGIYAEFGKIICLSVGFFNGKQLRIKSFAGDDEYKLLEDFANLLNKSFNKAESLLCAHNGKEFDFPFIARRMLVNGIKLPSILNIAGCKPWEVKHLDTMELWKFGDYKNYTSLELLTTIFNLETPKDDIHGNRVNDVYWNDHDLERIVTYCQKDVVAVAQLFLKYRGEDVLTNDAITFV